MSSVAASVTEPSGNILNNLSAFLLTNCCIAVASPFERLALGSVSFLTGIPISRAITSGAKSPSFLKVILFGSMPLIFSLTCSVISVTASAGNNELGLVSLVGFSSTTSVTSSATTPFASVTSVVNSSPKTLCEASIALAGKNLFI